VEADQVGAEHPFQKLPPGGQRPEQLLRGKRDVEEKPDPGVGQPAAEEAGEEQELVVVHPDHVARAVLLRDGVREELVDLDVGVPVAGLQWDLVEQVVKEGPEHPVGVTFVVAGHLVRGERDGDQPVLGELPVELGLLLQGQLPLRPRPPDPEPAGLLVRPRQSGREPTRAPLHLDATLGRTNRDGQPVGDDQKTGHGGKVAERGETAERRKGAGADRGEWFLSS
jgi:hypothetical protein